MYAITSGDTWPALQQGCIPRDLTPCCIFELRLAPAQVHSYLRSAFPAEAAQKPVYRFIVTVMLFEKTNNTGGNP